MRHSFQPHLLDHHDQALLPLCRDILSFSRMPSHAKHLSISTNLQVVRRIPGHGGSGYARTQGAMLCTTVGDRDNPSALDLADTRTECTSDFQFH